MVELSHAETNFGVNRSTTFYWDLLILLLGFGAGAKTAFPSLWSPNHRDRIMVLLLLAGVDVKLKNLRKSLKS